MRRTLLFAAIVSACTLALSAQSTSVLRVRVSLADAAGAPTPVARHRLLVSDNPATAPPREIVTAADGTAEVKLRPANYTVESDEPVILRGMAYHWTKTIDVAGPETVLDLTIGNALVEEPTPAETSELTGTTLLTRWQDSVAALWTPTLRSSGFVVDARGLVATSQRAIGDAKVVDVQLSPEVKVGGQVLAAEAGRDVAILRVDPSAIATITPIPLECGSATPPSPKPKDRTIAIGVPIRGPKAAEYGDLGRIGPHALETDHYLATGSGGGPAFAGDGRLIGLSSILDGSDDRHPDFRIIRVNDVCALLASAEKAMAGAPAPSAVRLPVEDVRPIERAALEAASARHAGTRNPYQASSRDFDVAFITPAQVFTARNQVRPKSLPVRSGRARPVDPYDEARQHALMNFGRWAEYFADDPPVLLVRASPRMVETFWKMIARGAALSQGISIPALKHFKSSFVRMQAFCGANEVTPIHPFTLTSAISETSSVTEGLYVFDPDALGPQCGTVKLLLYAEDSKDKGDPLVLDAALLRALQEEFKALRPQR